MAVLIGSLSATGGSDFFTSGDGFGTKFTASASGSVDTLKIQIDLSAYTNLYLAIYSDNAGVPGTLLGTGAAITSSAAGTQSTSLSPAVSVVSGTAYWLFLLPLGGGNLNMHLAPSGGYRGKSGLASYPSTWTASGDSTNSAGLPIQGEGTAGGTAAALTGTVAGVGAATGLLTAGVTVMGTGTPATAASGNVTANYPTGFVLAADDVIVCDVTARDNVVCTFPAGWTKKDELNNGAGLRKTIAWKRRAGGDSDTSVLVTHTAGAQIIATTHVIRGASISGDPFQTSSLVAVGAASSGVFPTLTVSVAGSLMMYSLGYQDDYLVAPSITNAQGLTLTERDNTEVP